MLRRWRSSLRQERIAQSRPRRHGFPTRTAPTGIWMQSSSSRSMAVDQAVAMLRVSVAGVSVPKRNHKAIEAHVRRRYDERAIGRCESPFLNTLTFKHKPAPR